MPQNLILDTGFWITFYEASDEHHAKARELAAYFDFSNLLIPWPSLYETLGTRFTRRAMWLSNFEPILSNPAQFFYRMRPTAITHLLLFFCSIAPAEGLA